MQGADGDTPYLMYFAEFMLDPAYGEAAGLFTMRSVLQLAPVTYDAAAKTLHADRDGKVDDFVMVPPRDRATNIQTAPTVWHVSRTAWTTCAGTG